VKSWMQILRFWWIPVSFAVPAICCYYLTQFRDHKDDLEGAIRIGQVGLLAAALVWAIWRLDVRLGARQKLSDSEGIVKLIVHLTGFALWICWFCALVIIAMAMDQVYSLPSTLPNLPG
nr:hypothetical protein [Candidatus Obscuribacter sp.]